MKTTSDNLSFSVALILTLWVALAGAWLCFVNPAHPWQPLSAAAFLGLGWTLRQVFQAKAQACEVLAPAQRKITQGILFAALILSVALIARLGWTSGLGEFGARANGVLMGVFVMYLANTIPKEVTRARGFAMRRTVGWAMVLGGLGYALSWLLLPMDYANDAAMAIMLCAFLYSAGRFLWFMHEDRSRRLSDKE